MRYFARAAELYNETGNNLGTSAPHVIEQDRIDQFAAATEDQQWIHVDADRARSGPFGSTLAHGYLVLSLLPVMLDEVFCVTDARMMLNYGLDRVRFPHPVPVKSELRGSVDMLGATPRNGDVLARFRVTVTATGVSKPTCIAEPLILYVG